MPEARYGEAAFRSVRWHLAHYIEISRAVHNARVERRTTHARPEVHAEGFVSNPTAAEAIANLTPLRSVTIQRYHVVQKPEEWLDCIDSVLRRLDRADYKLVDDAFFRRLPWDRCAAENYMSKDTFYRRRERIVAMIAIKASAAGLIALP